VPKKNQTIESTDCRNCYMKHRGCLSKGLDSAAERKFSDFLEHPPRLNRGEKLMKNTKDPNSVFLVKSGSLKRITRADKKNKSRILSFHFPGDIIGIENLYSNDTEIVSIALEPTHVCTLLCSDLIAMANENPELSKAIIKHLVEQLQHQDRTLKIISSTSAKQRIAGFILTISESHKRQGINRHHLKLPMTRDDIANYTGLARATVSRALGRLQYLDMIELGMRSCFIKDLEGLEKIYKTGHSPSPKLIHNPLSRRPHIL